MSTTEQNIIAVDVDHLLSSSTSPWTRSVASAMGALETLAHLPVDISSVENVSRVSLTPLVPSVKDRFQSRCH